MSYTKTTWVDNTTPINETNLNKIESGIKNNDINIGEENYDNTKTYEVGDIVRYNEKIYKCITAITTAENFDISKWEQTNIVEIVQSEKSKIYELIEAISTPIVGEGENITLNDTAEKRFENFDIEGNSEQETREGYNKLPIKFANATNNGITLTVKDNGKLLLNGTSTSTALFNAVLDNEISLNNYIFKIKKNSGTISANNVQFFLYTTGYTSNQNISVTPILSSSKTTLSSNAYTIERIVIPAETTLTDVELEVMISETEKQYEPYGASPSPDYPSEVESCGDNGSINEVICNKNLFDKNSAIKRYYYNSKGVLSLSDNWFYQNVKVKPNTTYYISGNVKNNNVAYFIEFDKNMNYVKTIGYYSSVSKFTTSDETQYVGLSIPYYEGADNDMNTLQLEEGTIETDYVEHKKQVYTTPTQQPMRAIGDVRDKFILKENGKWYERHDINRIIFNGLEDDFTVRNSGDEKTTYSFNYGITNVKNFGKEYIVSNMFTYNQASTNGKEGIGIPNNLENQIYFQIKRSRLSDISSSSEALNSFKNYLKELYNSNNPLYIDYVLKTPNDIECTSEQTEILNQIYIKAKSYKGITHIYSNDEVSPNCYVEAVKDLTTLIQ